MLCQVPPTDILADEVTLCKKKLVPNFMSCDTYFNIIYSSDICASLRPSS